MTGSLTVNVDPRPWTLSTVRSPPIRRQKWRLIASPSPVPPYRLRVDASAWENASNSRPNCSSVIPFQVFYGVSADTRSAWSITDARRIVGYEPQDDSEVVYADEIRELMLEPARQTMVQGEARGGKGSR